MNVLLVKLFLFSWFRFAALGQTINANEAPLTVTFKEVNDCPDAGEQTLKAFLEFYATCLYIELGGSDDEDNDNDVDIDDDERDRRLNSCTTQICNAYCNCRANGKSMSVCAIQVAGAAGCLTYCESRCNRRELNDETDTDTEIVYLVDDDVNLETFEEFIIADSHWTHAAEYGDDLWRCACDALEEKGINGTSNMCNCKNKKVDTWTNMIPSV